MKESTSPDRISDDNEVEELQPEIKLDIANNNNNISTSYTLPSMIPDSTNRYIFLIHNKINEKITGDCATKLIHIKHPKYGIFIKLPKYSVRILLLFFRLNINLPMT